MLIAPPAVIPHLWKEPEFHFLKQALVSKDESGCFSLLVAGELQFEFDI